MTASERPWARHYFEEWQRRSGDPRLPYWLRVAAAAYGSHFDNGHATFKRGELALILGRPGKPYPNVKRAIEDAVEFEWLAPGSFYRCLIVPERLARKGDLWAKPKPCPVHLQKRRNGSKTTSGECFEPRSSTPDEGFEPRKPRQVSVSERAPLFLICPPNPTTAEGDLTA